GVIITLYYNKLPLAAAVCRIHTAASSLRINDGSLIILPCCSQNGPQKSSAKDRCRCLNADARCADAIAVGGRAPTTDFHWDVVALTAAYPIRQSARVWGRLEQPSRHLIKAALAGYGVCHHGVRHY